MPLDKFSKNKNSKDGLQNVCKDCQRQYYEDNKEKRLNYRKNYSENNREKVLAGKRRYYHSNKSRFRKYYKLNKDVMLETASKWRKENPDKMCLHVKKYHQKISELPYTFTEEEWENVLKEFDYKCAYCGEEDDLEKEHFIPVSKDGSYTIDNIIPSCKRCNRSKYNRDFFEWYPTCKFYNKDREIHILNYLGYELEE